MNRWYKHNKPYLPTLDSFIVPDIIFLLLFFYMIVPNMHFTNLRTEYATTASSYEKGHLIDKTLITCIYVPALSEKIRKGQNLILINDVYSSVSEIKSYLFRKQMSLGKSDKNKIIVIIRIDKDAEMGVVSDVRKALKDTGIKRLNYFLIK